MIAEEPEYPEVAAQPFQWDVRHALESERAGLRIEPPVHIHESIRQVTLLMDSADPEDAGELEQLVSRNMDLVSNG
ncbi:hypothetical protein Snoj_32470 [Streptomyces nojiriensis]|uniref:Uncharacterized protein n=1 Tax=Streptomyces nojiriensis TaxID=66374 RepID=A0ABQ3SMG9_9ACTN|nr:hypothetical protein GCM10010205_74540 [Streptomyces nojiriensis]GHI69329.1 hypothetical protein Snoj_32470 [Streptomyces nojiriensis]